MLSVTLRFVVVAIALAQAAPSAAAEIQRLSPDVSVLIGKSGNVMIVAGQQGALIIDDQRASDIEETLAGVAEATGSPIRIVIDTHWHLDHSGSNEALAKGGATIIAQRNVRIRRSAEQFMVAYNQRIPAAAAIALPTITYDDTLEVHHGAETVELFHAANAHTDGDSIVRLKEANTIAMGDIFFNGIFPFIDRSSGGSIQGVIRGVDFALAMADDATRIVPSHGPVTTKGELLAYRHMLQDATERVRAAMRAGKDRASIIASNPVVAYRPNMEGDADGLVGAIYESLAAEHRQRTARQ